MSIKGTKTEKNLWIAFAGESQARNKYLSYGRRAKEEGYDDISDIFIETAKDEEEHATDILRFLGGVNHTLGNLRLSAQSEHYESETLYKEFERVALAEGLEDVAKFFNSLSEKEASHERVFLELARRLVVDQDKK
ncbi:MAG: rubrerythrin family protein [Flavobacteriales bacterium]|nr:rubrerythrin family protein [Flavobacteriales bacterium]